MWRDPVFATVAGGLILAGLVALIQGRPEAADEGARRGDPSVDAIVDAPDDMMEGIGVVDAAGGAAARPITAAPGDGGILSNPPASPGVVAPPPAATVGKAVEVPLVAPAAPAAEEPATASAPERLVTRSPGCPARFIRLTYQKPEFADRFFRSLSGSDLVEIGPCDTATGDFATRFKAGLGTLPDTSGTIAAQSISFDFGHLTNFTHGRHVRCSVNAPNQASKSRYTGSLSCTVLNDDETLGPIDVTVDL
jgi:hypothetical protein